MNETPKQCTYCRTFPRWKQVDSVTWECPYCLRTAYPEKTVILKWKRKADLLDTMLEVDKSKFTGRCT